jgi:large subunit ribosomal protein L4
MPLKMRRAALRSALSAKAADNGIMVVDEVAVAEPKTKLMAESLNNLVGDATVLVLLPGKDENYEVVVRSMNNLPRAKTLLASYLNIRDLLGYDRVIVPLKALDVISGYLG